MIGSIRDAQGPPSRWRDVLSPLTARLSARTLLFAAVIALLGYLIVVPMAFLVFGSLFTGLPGQSGTLTVEKYLDVLRAPLTYKVLLNSFEYAAGSSLLAFVVGCSLAWFVQRTDVPGKTLFTFLALFPMFMPVVIESVGWTLLLDPNSGLINRLLSSIHLPVFDIDSMQGMILVGGFINIPLVFLWMWPALGAMDPALEEAGTMSRSGAFRVIRTITLPLMMPALAATFLINLVLSMEDVVVPIVIGLPSHISVLSTEIFLAYTKVPVDVQAASVYGVILLAITLCLMALYRKLTSRSERYAIVRGRGYRPKTISLGAARWPLAVVALVVLIFGACLPALMLLWASLTPYVQVPSLRGFHTLTFRWYQQLVTNPMAIRGLVNSVILGAVTAVVIMALAIAIGWMIVRGRGRGRAVLDLLAFSPIAIPGLVLGLSLLWLYLIIPIPVYGTLAVLAIAFVTRFIPYGVRLVNAAIGQLHVELEEAAYVSRATWGRALRSITMPLLAPALMVSCVYTVMRVFQELGASLLLAGFGTEPYSLVAYNLWEGGQTGLTAAYGVVAMVLVAVMMIGAQRIARRPILPQ